MKHLVNGENLVDKKCSVYEFPTYELVTAIFKIAKYTNVKIYNEMFAGSGLLSRAVDNFNTHQDEFKFSQINCTDGFFEWETIGYKFYDVTQKCFYNIITDFDTVPQNIKNNYKKSMFVFSWMPREYGVHIKRFLTTLKPKCLVVIGNNAPINIPASYKHIKFCVKQMCYRDNPSNILSDTSHSYINLFVRSNSELATDILDAKLLAKPFEISLKTIVEDMNYNDIEKNTFYEYMIANPVVIPDIFSKMKRAKLTRIPRCVETIEDFHSYILINDILVQSGRYVELSNSIKDNRSLRQLVKCINEYMYCTDDKFEQGVKHGIFPKWLEKELVILYIICEHISNEKNIFFNADDY
jgi:hypothetical protein